MSKKHKMVCIASHYTDHSLILTYVFNRCVSISPFASLIGISVGITSSAAGLKLVQ